jgi:chloramphenicol-sensitive protein RarD
LNKGAIYALAAYMAWGLLPLYWKLFQTVSAWEILGNRIIWSFVFVAILLLMQKRWRSFLHVVKKIENLGTVASSSMLISLNWLIYIWAVNHDHVIEASLGYYMNPLINVCLGVLFLKERLLPLQWLAIALASLGVLILTVHYGAFPWIAISLALSFGLYGLAKKKMTLDSMVGLAWETAIVFPVALVFILTRFAVGQSAYSTLPAWSVGLLLLSGVATATPLLWFAQATKRLQLSTVGLFQYVSPTISLLLGVMLFHEPFTSVHAWSFTCIWVALGLYTWVSMKRTNPSRRLPKMSEQVSR